LAGRKAQPDAVAPGTAVSEVGVERVVANKGYHSKRGLRALAEVGVASVIAEPKRKRQKWTGQAAEQAAVYANRRRLETKTAKALMRRRGELVERSFAHLYDTGRMRRVHLRKKSNIAKRALIHASAFNLSLILRQLMGAGTARQAADLRAALCFWLIVLSRAIEADPAATGPTPRSSCRRRKGQRARSQVRTLSTGC
jgi:transposase